MVNSVAQIFTEWMSSILEIKSLIHTRYKHIQSVHTHPPKPKMFSHTKNSLTVKGLRALNQMAAYNKAS